jgi:hypothetical protein
MGAGGDVPFTMHPSSRRTGSEPLTGADAERLLAGPGAHPEAPAVQYALARLLDYAAGPPTDKELAGEVAAVAMFMLVTGRRGARHARSGNRFRVLPRRIRAMAVAACAGIVVAFSGAAVANALPAPVQELAHRTFGAPAPRHAIRAPKVPASSSGHGHGDPDPEASPSPSARGPHGKAKAKAIGKKSPTGSAHGKAKGRTVPPGHQKSLSPPLPVPERARGMRRLRSGGPCGTRA